MSDENKTPENGQSVHDEMEELARVFKEELDKAIKDAEEANIIDDIENIRVEGYDPKALSRDPKNTAAKEELCECCGERPRGTEKNPNSPFCSECEKNLEKYPYDYKGVVGLMVTVGVALCAIVLFAINLPVFANMKQGDKALGDGKLYTALAKYERAISAADDMEADMYNLYAKRAEAEYKLLDMSSALMDIEENIPEGVRKLPVFRGVRAMHEDTALMQVSAAAIQNHLNDFVTISDENYDEVIAMLDSLSGKKIYEKDGAIYDETDEDYTPDGTENVYIYDEGWLNIYKYSAAQYCEKDEETVITYLEKAAENSEYLDRLVSPLLAATYVGTGNYEKGAELAEKIRKHNAEGTDYYLITSMLYRYRDKDFQKGVDICQEGLDMVKSLTSGDELVVQIGYYLSMQKALNYIMLDDLENAYEAVTECFDYQNEAYNLTVQTRDMYAMLALATGDSDTFNGLEEEIAEYGDESIAFSSDVTDYKDGKITLQELAQSGRYDLI
ncbi:MAG: hypothetical protein J1F23_04155 [Oscillospiraceae bacterium]|nr:hypothetical protein [Oscillospiraceae bacterium]